MCTLHARSVFKNPLLVVEEGGGGKGETGNREVTGEPKLSLCLIMYHAMKVRVQPLGNRRGHASSVPPRPLYRRELTPVVRS
jgi:hypothetical protein